MLVLCEVAFLEPQGCGLFFEWTQGEGRCGYFVHETKTKVTDKHSAASTLFFPRK